MRPITQVFTKDEERHVCDGGEHGERRGAGFMRVTSQKRRSVRLTAGFSSLVTLRWDMGDSLRG